MKRAAIVNPYLDTLGGGERYTLGVVRTLLKNDYIVDIEWKDKEILKKIEDRFGIKLHENVNVLPDLNRGDGYDLCFWVSDGSIPALRSRNNFLHFQVPFQNVHGKSLINRTKLLRVKKVICNSNFTKEYIDKEYGVKSEVIYPPVDIEKFKPKRKENIILYVGRFSQLLQSKGQEILVEVFKRFYKAGYKDWKLYLVGGTEVGGRKFVNNLRIDALGAPVIIKENINFKELKGLYGKATFFWSASGFNMDEEEHPEMVEHFGITLVEAMAAGAIPLAVKKGGHKEIIDSAKNGFLWSKKSELLTLTELLVSDKKKRREMVKSAKERSKYFSYESFEKNFTKLL